MKQKEFSPRRGGSTSGRQHSIFLYHCGLGVTMQAGFQAQSSPVHTRLIPQINSISTFSISALELTTGDRHSRIRKKKAY